MADLSNLEAAETVKIVGANSSGVETNPVNATTGGGLHTNLRDSAGAETGTASNPLRLDPTGTTTQPISAASLPLPTGASTAANQTTANASLSSIDSKTPALVGGRQPVDGSGVTQPISAVSLPLPTGAATSTLQTTGNNSLASIDNKLTAPLSIVGSVAAGSADSGNPVKTGGIYTTTIPLLSTGQRGNHQVDENSVLMTTINEAGYTAMQKVFSTTNTSALTVGTSEVAILLFRNPSGNTLKFKLLRIFLTGAATYRFYFTPTVTSNGTALAAINQKIMTSPAAATATPFQSPTVTSNGTLIFPVSATTQSGTAQIQLDHQPILAPNMNLLITAQAGSNNTSVNVTLFWAEIT